MRLEILASTRLVKPGSALGSKMTLGTPLSQVASIIGPAAYPPTPKAATGLCLRSTVNASARPGPSIARFLTSVPPPLPLSPATRSVSSGSPACGTSFISIPRCVPTSTTSRSVPRDIHSRAMASAGKTWPPVPPPAISSFMPYARSPCRLRGLLRNIQEHAGGQQHHQQTRATVADKRQRNPFRRHHAQHHSKINERLKQNHRCDTESEQPPKSIRRPKSRTQAAPAVHREQRDDNHRAEKAQFLANHCVNEIGMRLRQIKKFLLALHQAHTGKSTGANRN